MRIRHRQKTVGLQPVMDAYDSSAWKKRRADGLRRQAERVVEPPRDEIYRSCQLALAFERFWRRKSDVPHRGLLRDSCIGTAARFPMRRPFVRLNNMGGICESDSQSAMTPHSGAGSFRKAGIYERSDHG